MSKTPLERAVDFAGTQAALGRGIGVSQQAVSNWLAGKAPVTAENAVAIETFTEGAIMRHELRPDLFSAPSDTN